MAVANPSNTDARSAGARGVVYKVLAEAFDYPTSETFDSTKNGRIVEVLREAAHDGGLAGQPEIDSALEHLGRSTGDLDSGVQLIDLEVEYNRLFAPTESGILCSPFEGVVRGLSIAEKVNNLADVMGFYRAWGVDLSDRHDELPDNIVVELEFLHLLACKEHNAIQSSEQEYIERTHDSQRSFLEDHALLWVGQFSDLVAQHTTCDWYRALARFLRAFVRSDGVRLQVAQAGEAC